MFATLRPILQSRGVSDRLKSGQPLEKVVLDFLDNETGLDFDLSIGEQSGTAIYAEHVATIEALEERSLAGTGRSHNGGDSAEVDATADVVQNGLWPALEDPMDVIFEAQPSDGQIGGRLRVDVITDIVAD